MNKKIIFFSTPAYGHIISSIPVVEKLVKEGYEVDYFSTKEYEDIVKNVGAKYLEYEVDFDVKKLEKYTSNFIELFKVLTETNHKAYKYYENKINYKEYDLIIYDSMCSFAKNIAYKKNKKSICIETTLAYNVFVFFFSNLFWNNIILFLKNMGKVIRLLKEEKLFRKKNELKKFKTIDLFVNSGDKTIVFSPKELQPFYWTFNKELYFVGTTIKERLQTQKKKYKSYKYFISVGSVYKANPEIVKEILKIKDLEKNSIAIVTNEKIKDIDTYDFVEQIAFLKNIEIFINHGGLNSVYEAIYLNKKQIIIPVQEEQRLTAIICKNKKIGIYTKKYKNISKKIKNVRKRTKNLDRYSKIIKSYDGTIIAYNIIDKYIKEGE